MVEVEGRRDGCGGSLRPVYGLVRVRALGGVGWRGAPRFVVRSPGDPVKDGVAFCLVHRARVYPNIVHGASTKQVVNVVVALDDGPTSPIRCK